MSAFERYDRDEKKAMIEFLSDRYAICYEEAEINLRDMPPHALAWVRADMRWEKPKHLVDYDPLVAR